MGGRFGGGRGGSRGGMRGRKQQNGSFKIHNGSKLRPAPEKPFLDATETSRVVKGKGKGKGKLVPIDQEQPDEEEEDMEEFGYREDLRPERRPLEGVVLCVTGATEVKSALLLEAKELGATTSKTLSIETTHLVATVAGSAKYEMAVLHKMKIVLPTWISAVGEAWRGAKDIDLAGLEAEHLMTAFHRLTFCVTSFARGPHKSDFVDLISSNGAAVTPGLTKEVTHLIVASATSPHSQTGLSEKLVMVSKARQLGKASVMKVVWEGWAKEAIEHGGVRAEREAFWAWSEGVPEPVVEMETPVETKARQSKKRNMRGEDSFVGLDRTATADGLMEIYGEGSEAVEDRTVTEVEQEGEKHIPVATRKKPKSRHGAGLNSVDQLLSSYTNLPNASTSKSILPPGLVAPHRLDSKKDENSLTLNTKLKEKPRPLEMERAEETGLRIGSKVANSVIKAISTSRATSFVAPPTAIPRPFTRANSARATSDDSAFFDDIPPTKVPPRSEPDVVSEPKKKLFEGLSFVLVETKGSESIIRKSIEENGGTVMESENDDPSCYIMALAFDAPERLRNSTNPLLVTECWLERCLYEEKVIVPSNRLVDRPVSFTGPVSGAEKLVFHISNYDPVDKTHLTRYLRHIGAATREQFNPAFVNHLMHVAIDKGETPTGLKALNAEKSSMPIVGIEWVKEFAESAAKTRDSAVAGRISAKEKGKGRMSEVKDEKISDELVKSRVLAGCVLFLSPRLSDNERQRSKSLAESLGGKLSKTFKDDSTHLIHASSRPTDTFKEFKLAKSSGKFIVHPQWLEACSSTGMKVGEVSFPHQYDMKKSHQLASLIIPSPPRNSPRVSPRPLSPAPVGRTNTDVVQAVVVQKSVDSRPQGPTPSASPTPLRGTTPTLSRPAQEDPFADPASAQRVPSPVTKSLPETTISRQPPPLDTAPSSLVPPPVIPAVAESVPEVPPAPMQPPAKPKPKRNLVEESMAMQAQLLAPLGGVNTSTGQRRARVSRKKSIPENRPLAAPVIAPAYDPSRRVPGVGQLLDSDPFEEESMCVTFDDPASKRAREQIYAAVRGEVHVEDRSEEVKAARRREEDERLPKRSREEDDDSRRSTRRR